jgi:hypothetical protein
MQAEKAGCESPNKGFTTAPMCSARVVHDHGSVVSAAKRNSGSGNAHQLTGSLVLVAAAN